jgi:hypothetical protein
MPSGIFNPAAATAAAPKKLRLDHPFCITLISYASSNPTARTKTLPNCNSAEKLFHEQTIRKV